MAQVQYDEDRAMACQEQQASGQPSQDISTLAPAIRGNQVVE